MKNLWLIIGNGIILLALLVLGLYNLAREEKQAYLDTAQVFDAFTLQKELRTQLENLQSKRQTRLDSMELRLKAMAGSSEFDRDRPGQEFISLSNLYTHQKKKFDEENLRLSREYDRQIWNQLNQYIEDFGEEKNYTMIFGANGQGNLMYAKDTKDITQELIDYINRKYERVS